MLQVRRATVEDANAIAEIHVASWLDAYRGIVPPEILATLDVDESTRHWLGRIGASRASTDFTNLVEENGHPVGFVTYGPCRDTEPPVEGEAEIYAFYLHPAAWARRIGAHLMVNTLAAMHTDGYRRASVWVIGLNLRALRFYTVAGFRTDGVAKPWRKDEFKISEIRLSRALEPPSPGVAESDP